MFDYTGAVVLSGGAPFDGCLGDCSGGTDDGGADDGGAGDCVDTDNGAVDPYGDDCAAYNAFPSWCGNYDDDDFFSLEMCCICGGGDSSGGTDDGGADDGGADDGGADDGGAGECVDTDNGAVDPYGDDCAAYNAFPSWCGNYDDDDFFSLEMCCVCGGGTGSTGDDGGSGDAGGDDGADTGGSDVCEFTECTLTLMDSYGDGWNGNVWESGDQSATLNLSLIHI